MGGRSARYPCIRICPLPNYRAFEECAAPTHSTEYNTTVLITRKCRSKSTAHRRPRGRDLSPLKACVDRYAFTQIDNNF